MEPLIAVYARVSTERQAEAQTIEQQMEALGAYALARAGHEFELPERRVEVYRFQERWRRGDRRGDPCGSGPRSSRRCRRVRRKRCATVRDRDEEKGKRGSGNAAAPNGRAPHRFQRG